MWWVYFLATFYIGTYNLWGPAYWKAHTRPSTLVSRVLCLCSQVKLVLGFMSFFTSKDPLPLCQFTVLFKRLIFIITLTSSHFLQLEIHLIFFFLNSPCYLPSLGPSHVTPRSISWVGNKCLGNMSMVMAFITYARAQFPTGDWHSLHFNKENILENNQGGALCLQLGGFVNRALLSSILRSPRPWPESRHLFAGWNCRWATVSSMSPPMAL